MDNCSSLENCNAERYCGFESYTPRHLLEHPNLKVVYYRKPFTGAVTKAVCHTDEKCKRCPLRFKCWTAINPLFESHEWYERLVM